ncbi:MAG: glycosyltransferase family 39 protein [Pyrinomonadaceae bacterium]
MKNQTPPPALTNNKAQILLFSVLIFAAYFVGLGTLPFLGPDEPRYAEVAREMFSRSDFVTTTLGELNWFEKPALAYWLMMAGYKTFGINEFAARFGSALFGLLTIGTVYWLCRFVEKTNDEGQRANDGIAFWAVLVSASSIGLIAFSHAASFDIILTFPITAALACFFAFDIGNPKSKIQNPKFLIGFYFFIGVALLAKGLIGAVLPLGIIFWYFILSQKLPNKAFLLSLLWGTLLACATAATWYAPMLLRHGGDFFNEFFVQQQFARYTSNKYQHPEPVWFFWLILPALTLPWLPFFAIAIWRFFKAQSPKSKVQSPVQMLPQKLKIFCVVWLTVPLVFFTFSSSKLPGYILPALPAALILAAEQVERFVKNNRNRRLVFQVLAIIILLAVPIFLNTFAVGLARYDTTKFLLEAANGQGLSNAKVLNLHDISHSLEFYAAGRLVRLPDGKQWKFEGTREIWNYLQLSNEQNVLVLVPVEHEHQLYETNLFTAHKVADNGAFALVAVTQKKTS